VSTQLLACPPPHHLLSLPSLNPCHTNATGLPTSLPAREAGVLETETICAASVMSQAGGGAHMHMVLKRPSASIKRA